MFFLLKLLNETCNIYLSGDTLSEEEVMMLINAADRDGDGTLDFEEFVRIMMG